MLDEVRRVALFTSGVAELTRHRAEQIVKSWVGDVGGNRASTMVRQLVETSRQNRKELTGLIRSEIQGQIAGLGLATKRDLERLERRVGRLEDAAKKTSSGTARSGSSPKKTTAKRTTAKKSSARRSTGGGPGGGSSS